MPWRQQLKERLAFAERLGFRLATLLSVAILPLGLISIVQTRNLEREAERAGEVALLGRTASAAAGERALLQSALSVADALGPAVLESLGNDTDCSELMATFIERSATYLYASYVQDNGQSRCNSARKPQDLSGFPEYRAFMDDPVTQVVASQSENALGRPMVMVLQPLYRQARRVGYISVGLSPELLASTHPAAIDIQSARILTFNEKGQVLSAQTRNVPNALPHGETLASLSARADTTFRSITEDGEERVFSVISVVPGMVYALGSWPLRAPDLGFAGRRGGAGMTAVLFPLILWAASLAVAYFAVYRLVIRHIRELRGQMRRFALGTRNEAPPVLTDAPSEITDVSQTFHNMARILIRDSDELEKNVQEKTVLLKEVHHRVKNNLQLIASIINMQSRVIDDPDAKRVLRSVQDRVASLASIYKNLYQAEHLDAVEADRLIGDIVNQMVNASVGPGSGLKVETEIEALTLLPDQAVPLSLLATEAFTNALKYTGTPKGQKQSWVRVVLSRPKDGFARLEVSNSIGAGERPVIEGTGLGSQLIEAFTLQLDGEADIATITENEGTANEADVFRLRLTFPVAAPLTNSAPPQQHVVLTSAARDGAMH